MRKITRKILIFLTLFLLIFSILPVVEVQAGIPDIPLPPGVRPPTENEMRMAVQYYNTFWKYKQLGQKIAEMQRMPPGDLVHWLIPAAQATYTQAQVFLNSLPVTPSQMVRFSAVAGLGGVVVMEQDWSAYWDFAFNNQEFMESYQVTNSVVGDWIVNFTNLDEWAMSTLEFVGLPRILGVDHVWDELDATEVYMNGVQILNDFFAGLFGLSSDEQLLAPVSLQDIFSGNVEMTQIGNTTFRAPRPFLFEDQFGQMARTWVNSPTHGAELRVFAGTTGNQFVLQSFNAGSSTYVAHINFHFISNPIVYWNSMNSNLRQFYESRGVMPQQIEGSITLSRHPNLHLNPILLLRNDVITQIANQTQPVQDMLTNPDIITPRGTIPINPPIGGPWAPPQGANEFERAQHLLERFAPSNLFPHLPNPDTGQPNIRPCPICPPGRMPWQCPHQRPGQEPHGCPLCPPIITPGLDPQPCSQPYCPRTPANQPDPEHCPICPPGRMPWQCPHQRPGQNPHGCPLCPPLTAPGANPQPCPQPNCDRNPATNPNPNPNPRPQSCPYCPPINNNPNAEPHPCTRPECNFHPDHPNNPNRPPAPPPGPRPPPAVTFAMFPFCIPWDVYNLVNTLIRTPLAPSFEAQPFSSMGINWTLSIDFEIFSPVISIFRWAMRILFVIGLAVITRKYIWTGGG